MGHELRWEKGRQLKSFDGNTYTYNANGIRTSKTIDGVTHTYILDGIKILRETWDGNTLIPLYDNEESVCGILFNETPYYFQKNLQGDIIAITDAAGLVLARYAYDAWGKCTIIDRVDLNPVIDINPYRYRSYYYDPEIQMYYLQSRYYDPETGRFVNGDDPLLVVVNSTAIRSNLFTYCLNGVINFDDSNGMDAIWLQATGSVFGMGHTGLLFQYQNKWYYWYWGFDPDTAPASYARIASLCLANRGGLLNTAIKTAAVTVCAKVNLRTITPKNKITSSNYKDEAVPLADALYESKTKFVDHFYIKGDFTKAYSFFAKLKKQRNYNLLFNNCMQTTTDGLRRGTFASSHYKNIVRMAEARLRTVPNFAYNYLKQFF